MHFQEAKSSNTYKEKIYDKLRTDDIRDRILNGTLCQDECDNQNVFNFLQLLKKSDDQSEMNSIKAFEKD